MSTTLGQLLADLAPGPHYVRCGPELPVEALRVDSRLVGPGDAFLALRGGTVDAHRFVPDVLRAGASVVIVERGVLDVHSQPAAFVELDDTATAYPWIAANAHGRPADRLRLAGVTGTNGKTTTAHLVGSILTRAGRAHTRLGTTGNFIVDHEAQAGFTTPFPLELQALLRQTVDRGGTDLVMEVSSHALAQARVEPLRFAAVGLTSFSQDHLDFHPTMEAYLQAKCLLAGHHLRSDGIAIAAVDGHPAAAAFLTAARGRGATAWRASRGDDATADVLASGARFDSDGISARVQTPSGAFDLRSPLISPYNLDNLLVATGLALGLGIDTDTIASALLDAVGAPGRMERVHVSGIAGPEVRVDYAHTPDAVERAIAAVRGSVRGRLWVVLGCGGDRDPGKRPLMGAAAARGGDRFYATSDNPRTEDPERIIDQMLQGVDEADAAKVVREVDRATAIARAIGEAAAEDLVLIAGKGHEDYQVLGTHKIHFDDREHARAALRRRS